MTTTIKEDDLAISIYTRMISAKHALEDARRLALEAAVPAYMPDINEALGCVDRLMLECMSGNPMLGMVMPLVNRLVMEHASRERVEPSND